MDQKSSIFYLRIRGGADMRETPDFVTFSFLVEAESSLAFSPPCITLSVTEGRALK